MYTLVIGSDLNTDGLSLGARFHTAGRQEKGWAIGHTWWVLVAGEGPGEGPNKYMGTSRRVGIVCCDMLCSE